LRHDDAASQFHLLVESRNVEARLGETSFDITAIEVGNAAALLLGTHDGVTVLLEHAHGIGRDGGEVVVAGARREDGDGAFAPGFFEWLMVIEPALERLFGKGRQQKLGRDAGRLLHRFANETIGVKQVGGAGHDAARELAEQVYKATEAFAAFCSKDIRAVNLTQRVSDAVQRSLLAEAPDIVIATPARASLNLNTSALSLDHLAHLVIDEADLVLSYGYDEDLQNVAKIIPKGVQTILMSATLTGEVETLKGLFCRDPVTLELEETETEGAGVSQYVVR